MGTYSFVYDKLDIPDMPDLHMIRLENDLRQIHGKFGKVSHCIKLTRKSRMIMTIPIILGKEIEVNYLILQMQV